LPKEDLQLYIHTCAPPAAKKAAVPKKLPVPKKATPKKSPEIVEKTSKNIKKPSPTAEIKSE
jgi:hypothetical protein